MKPSSVLAVAIFSVFAASAQPQVPPAFEAASVKPTDPATGGSTFNFAPGAAQIAGGTVRKIVEMAYDLRTFQILGGPSWTDTDRYDISATNDAAVRGLNREQRYPEMRLRLQTLLADRFQLKVHRETREAPEYALVLAKGGHRLKESDAGADNGINMGCGSLRASRARMADLVLVLSRQLERPVIDNTGLGGRYDFEMVFLPEGACASRLAEVGANGGDGLTDRPSIFTAIQAQLGLKLESTKGPVEVIVIDHVEKPEPN